MCGAMVYEISRLGWLGRINFQPEKIYVFVSYPTATLAEHALLSQGFAVL
jgi:hypothetical protein